MNSISGYLGFTLVYFLLFAVSGVLFNIYKERINSFLTNCCPVLLKIPGDTLLKGITVAGIILLIRKVLYYISIPGIIQSEYSIWWMDEKVVLFLFFAMAIYIIFLVFLGIVRGYISIGSSIGSLLVLIVFISFILLIGYGKRNFLVGDSLVLSLLAPFFILKMLCSGKYWGIFLSLLLGYFVIDRTKKIRISNEKKNSKFLLWPGILFIAFWIFSIIYFPAGAKRSEGFQQQIIKARYESQIWNKLAALRLLKDDSQCYNMCKLIIKQLSESELKSRQKFYVKLIKIINSNKIIHFKSDLLKDLSISMLNNGDIQMALDASSGIQVPQYKFEAYLAVIPKVKRMGDGKVLNEIIPKAIETAQDIPRYDEKSNSLRKLAEAVFNINRRKQAINILEKAISDAEKIDYAESRNNHFAKLALCAAKMGDTQRALTVTEGIKSNLLKNEIVKKINLIEKK